MNIGEWFREHSTIIFIVIVGLVAGVAFLKRNPNSTATTTPASTMDTTGLQTDSSGVPIIYRDVADTFINVSVNPNSTQPVASAPPTSGTEHPIEPTGTSTAPTGTTVTSTIATIRQRVGTLGGDAGVPIRSGTDGNASVVRTIPYGSQIGLNGGPVQGGNNNPKSGGSGSTTWYPVPGGYLSAYDISSISSSVSQTNSQTQTVRNG